MGQENTPPPSPSEAIMDDDDDVGEPLEVIDLDELEEQGLVEEVEDDGEDELEDGADDNVIQEEIEDNSILKFEEHSGKMIICLTKVQHKKFTKDVFKQIFFSNHQIQFFASMFNQKMTIQWWHQEDKMMFATFGL